MIKYPNIRIIFDRRNTSSQKSEGTVEIEISFEGKRKWISTGVRILPKNWSDTKKVVERHDSIDLNMKIENLENKILNHIRKLIIGEKAFTWAGLEQVITHHTNPNSFILFVKERVTTRKDLKPGTLKNHKKFFNALEDFGKIRDFEDLTKENIQAYEEWLRNRYNYTQSTIASYHKFMKIYVNEAIRRDMLAASPYKGIKIDRGKPRARKYLTQEELSSIESRPMPSPSIDKVRDMFVFQCYTGLAYADMSNFDFKKTIDKSGKFILQDSRRKTGEDFYIVLLPKAMQILKKYDYKLPIMTNEQYNLRLKIVADAAGIEKNLTSHMGRHTYATLCLNNGVQIEILAKMLGHSDIKTTQIYAKLVNKTVENAYEQLQKKLEENSGLTKE